ncbi:MAG: acyl-CoA thioesterase [Verrucomicrobia bacterium]|nr:acyl-CoA thioesterase [Verrucomicrobiota bacterium]NBS78986.1 acyl-CoA thioesterase [bacterium]
MESDRGKLQVVCPHQGDEAAGKKDGAGVRGVVSGRAEAERDFTVYFFDTDAGGVVHNLSYLRWIEAVRTDLAELLGWGIGEMVGGDHGCPVLTRTEVEYLRPAKLGERVRVVSRLGEVGKVRFVVESEVKGAEGQLFCRAKQELASVDLRTGKAKALREDWRKRHG